MALLDPFWGQKGSKKGSKRGQNGGFRGFRAPAGLVAPDGLFQLLPLEKGSKKGQKRVVFGRFPCSFIVETCSKQWFLVVFGVFGPLRVWLLQTGFFSYYPSKRGQKRVKKGSFLVVFHVVS